MDGLQGQVALVTGAGRGIGRALALGLAARGMRIGLVGRSRSSLDGVLSECARAGAKAVSVAADVTDGAAVRAAVGTVERDLGPVDLLVCNAGSREAAAGAPWAVDPDDWWRTVETNLRGTFLTDRAVLPGMVARGRGRVVHVGSGMGQRPQPEWSAYGVSKAALTRWTDSVASALEGTGVTVIEISPGLVRSDMTEMMWGDPAEQPWNDVGQMVDAVVRVARGDLDGLHGRFVHAVRDDLDALLADLPAIAAADARTLRLRPYGDADPLA